MNAFDALGDAELRSTLLFVRAQADAVTADDVARELSVSRSAARWRLERLAEAGLLVTAFARPSGRTGPGAGRPAKLYAAAAETEAIEFPQRRYETLLRLLIESTPRRGRAQRLKEVGHAFGLELARAAGLRRGAWTRATLERLCCGLGQLGFQARVESVARDRAVIVTATCPLRPLVVGDRAARALDQGMWSGLVASAAGAAARCETHDCLERASACRVEITRS